MSRAVVAEKEKRMSEFRIKTLVLGPVGTNCYLVYRESKDREGKKAAVVVDPAGNAPHILQKCQELGLTPVAILLTHGHFDHIMAVQELHSACGCKVYIGAQEDRLLRNATLNMSGGMWGQKLEVAADVLVRDGEVLTLAGYDWRVMETPGHTEGSVCYLIESEGVLISGDTLFAESLGRTDLPTGSSAKIVASIVEKLLVLPDDTLVYPGHGDPTTVGHEKRYNPVAVYRRR